MTGLQPPPLPLNKELGLVFLNQEIGSIKSKPKEKMERAGKIFKDYQMENLSNGMMLKKNDSMVYKIILQKDGPLLLLNQPEIGIIQLPLL